MITTTKFTPGPWVARPDKNSSCEWEVVKTKDNASFVGDYWFIADIHDDADGCSSEANARLIAAAPELYEAGAEALGILDQYFEFLNQMPVSDIELHPYIPSVEIARDALRAALAKSGAVA